ncbi:hypothetical protein SASPL_115209 [Salvia splendens]|uniref:Amino acid transporter transmembrane domain-containing protein n=1 Tax=Salvia splendens TaxID=180675 RepID=A0A8X8Y4R5_SALSN|nr:hypothetical protein SASPL_115209 [Salvia splendens]
MEKINVQVDNRTAEQKAIDDWLPITSSRNAKWWYSAFHNVTAMVGAGVLGLPFAMSELGWGPGVAVMVISWIITFYTLWQMVEMHEMVPGKRFDRYHELGQHAFGEKLGLYIVVPQQLIVEVGVDIVYMVTGGKSLQKFHDVVCGDNCKSIKLTYFIMIFASVHFVLSHLPNLNAISGVSLAAAVIYSTIAWGAAVKKGVQPNVQYGYKATTTAGTVFNFFSALGEVAFAYAGHNVVLEIQATIPSTPEKPSKGPMWKGVIVAYIVVALCYFPVAFIGYWMFGNEVSDNILISLNKPHWLIAMANIFVVIHVIGSYQIYAMPVFDMLETVLVKKLRFKPTCFLVSCGLLSINQGDSAYHGSLTGLNILLLLKGEAKFLAANNAFKMKSCPMKHCRIPCRFSFQQPSCSFLHTISVLQEMETKEAANDNVYIPDSTNQRHQMEMERQTEQLKGPGVANLVLSWIITLYTLWQMVEMHEMRWYLENVLKDTMNLAKLATMHLGEMVFAYASHNVVLEIQATILTTPEMPSKKLMWKCVFGAYCIVALCYFPIALINYRMFGNQIQAQHTSLVTETCMASCRS